jgi:hypothetical protein
MSKSDLSLLCALFLVLLMAAPSVILLLADALDQVMFRRQVNRVNRAMRREEEDGIREWNYLRPHSELKGGEAPHPTDSMEYDWRNL